MRSIVSTIVTHTVVLGGSGYGDRLTVTASGAVEPGGYGATAILAPATLGTANIINGGLLR